MRKLKEPVMLIGAEKETICLPQDLAALEKLAPVGSKKIQIATVNHFALGYCFHELAEPVTSWFHQHLEQAPGSNPEKRLLISTKAGGGDSPSKSIQPSPK